MLTNKNFVRSIAMLLAMLMVMALCLTGCGNKAADEALTKAEEAKTVADEVKAALANYLTTADAEAKVNALVDAALADGAATKAEIQELSAKLADYVTLAQVEALITEKIAASAIAGAVTKAEIEEILSKYYTKEEVDAKFENYFGEFTAEEVLTILKDAMSLKEWDKTSDVVLKTIEDLQILLDALNTETYTQANMKKVNECLAPFGIVAFADGADADTRLDELKGDADAIAAIAKALEYTILRQATLEDMAELKAAVDAAVAVPTFEKSFSALKADLYGLGDLYTVGDYDGTNNAWNPDKYAAAGYYHESPVAKNGAVQVQIVTLVDKAGFHAFNEGYDALLAEYYADKTHATGADGWIENLAAYNVYKVTTNTLGTVTTDLQIALTTATTAPANSEKLGTTVITDDAYLNKVFMGELKENEVLVSPLYTPDVTTLNYGDVTTDWKTTKTFEQVIDDLDLQQNGFGTWKSAYTLVYAQLDFVQLLADFTNNIFEGGVTTDADNSFVANTTPLAGSFLYDVIYANTDTMKTTAYNKVTDEAFLAALTAAMCEPIAENLPSSSEYSYLYYLLDDVDPMVQTFKMANGQAYDPTVGGFDRWSLYEAMMDKSFDLLWNKYKAQANEWANIILKDYISIVYEAKANQPGNVNGEAAISPKYNDTTKLAADMSVLGTGLTAGETTTAAELTTGFIAAFLTGDNTNFKTSKVYSALKLEEKFKNSNLAAFYLNNKKAVLSTTKVGDTATSTTYVWANPLASIEKNAENIRQRLTGSATYTELQIARADMATYKATGVSVREAFYDLLKEEIDNLDEIYGRFLFEDYKLMTYNNMVAKAAKIVTFYNKGVANAAQTAAVERYLTGVANESTINYTTGINVAWDASNPKKATSITFKANDLEASLTNGFLVTNVSKVTCDLWATSSPSGTDKVADAAMAKVDEFAAAATTTIENMVIKANFLNYLYEARGNLAAANVKYTNYIMGELPTAWDIKSALINENGLADDQITVTEFFHNRNDYKLADYKTAYVDNVLKLVADKDNLHVLLLSGKTIDEIVNLADQAAEAAKTFANELKAVKSSDDAKVWVVRKYSPYTANADYYYIGTYAVTLDTILNTMPGKVTQYKTDAGNVNLY